MRKLFFLILLLALSGAKGRAEEVQSSSETVATDPAAVTPDPTAVAPDSATIAPETLTLEPPKLEVVASTDANSPYGQNIRIVRRMPNNQLDPAFHPVECLAMDGWYRGVCEPVQFPDGKFIIKDCFLHDNSERHCRVAKFNADGTPDASFKSPFSYKSVKQFFGTKHAMVASKVSLMLDGNISIEGEFMSPLVGWNEKWFKVHCKDVRRTCPGIFGTVVLNQKGKFLSFKPNIYKY